MHYNLGDMIADIAQNSVEAEATQITLECIQTDKSLRVTITDNGKGMSAETLEHAKDPFYTNGIKHPNRKIGLGIPFLIQTTEETDGSWDIKSIPGKGTTVFMIFNLTNIDTPPIGDIPDLFFTLLTLPGKFDMNIHRCYSQHQIDYQFSKNEVEEALGGDLESAASLTLLKQFLISQESGTAA